MSETESAGPVYRKSSDAEGASPRRPTEHKHGKWLVKGKAVVPVLIGLVSVSSALLTWRALLLGEEATENDRRSVRDTAIQERIRVTVESRLQSDRRTYASVVEKIAAARSLQSASAELARRGRAGEAQSAQNEAKRLRSEALQLGRLHFFDFSQAVTGGDLDHLEFNADVRRAELTRREEASLAERADPQQAADHADALRRRSERLVLLLAVMVTAIFVLTSAHVTPRQRLRTPLAGLGTVIWLSASALALTIST